MPGITETAPAKLNLYLHVLGRRPDGYHELDSLVLFADIGDTVTVRSATALSLTVAGPFAAALAGEPPEGNLVVRAALALALALGRPAEVALALTKVLPVASGIGGGSADAAACLRALARLWRVPAEDPRLMEVAAELGADVPVCLAGRAAYFGGIGDILDPVPPLPECPAVLVNPGLPLPTPAVFKARRGPFSAAARFERAPADLAGFAAQLATRRNDLTEPAIALVPEIAAVLETLAGTRDCRLARLSGSGATCFALYPDAQAAATAAQAVDGAHPGWWVRPCRLRGAPSPAPRPGA